MLPILFVKFEVPVLQLVYEFVKMEIVTPMTK